ncbi:MAG: hypothetical protein KIT14_12670 [bacterium]|nr:hypothetical protein [bacterium]
MAEWAPIARRAITEPAYVRDGLELRAADEVAATLVHARSGAHDVPMGRARRDAGGTLVVGTAPGQWLVLGAAAGVDLTHFYAALRLTGPRAETVLRAVCAIDLGDAVTPHGAAFRAPVAGVPTDVVRDDLDGTPSYLLLVDRSYARYLWHALLDAAP